MCEGINDTTEKGNNRQRRNRILTRYQRGKNDNDDDGQHDFFHDDFFRRCLVIVTHKSHSVAFKWSLGQLLGQYVTRWWKRFEDHGGGYKSRWSDLKKFCRRSLLGRWADSCYRWSSGQTTVWKRKERCWSVNETKRYEVSRKMRKMMTTRRKEMGGEGNWETRTREVCLCKFVLQSWRCKFVLQSWRWWEKMMMWCDEKEDGQREWKVKWMREKSRPVLWHRSPFVVCVIHTSCKAGCCLMMVHHQWSSCIFLSFSFIDEITIQQNSKGNIPSSKWGMNVLSWYVRKILRHFFFRSWLLNY